jgi:hypothetical protein
MFICDVPALNVNCAVFVNCIAGARAVALESVNVLLLNSIDFALPLFDKTPFAVTLYPAVSNVPCVTSMYLVDIVIASPSVTVMPEPLIVTPLNVLPAVVSVAVAVNVIVPVWVYV